MKYLKESNPPLRMKTCQVLAQASVNFNAYAKAFNKACIALAHCFSVHLVGLKSFPRVICSGW